MLGAPITRLMAREQVQKEQETTSGHTTGNSGAPQIERFGHAQAAAVEEAGNQAAGIARPVPYGLEASSTFVMGSPNWVTPALGLKA